MVSEDFFTLFFYRLTPENNYKDYQNEFRIYLDEYPEQKELREEYFKKEEKRNRYFYKRFMERN